jgi:hypothetical protein
VLLFINGLINLTLRLYLYGGCLRRFNQKYSSHGSQAPAIHGLSIMRAVSSPTDFTPQKADCVTFLSGGRRAEGFGVNNTKREGSCTPGRTSASCRPLARWPAHGLDRSTFMLRRMCTLLAMSYLHRVTSIVLLL